LKNLIKVFKQCCGSGIRCLFDPWIWDPGWVKSQDPDPGSRIRDEQPGSYFLADPGSGIRGWKKFGFGIRDGKKSDPGSGKNIPDPQHGTYLSIHGDTTNLELFR
jgi:hypothetical protein